MRSILLPLAAATLCGCSHLPASVQERIYAFQKPCPDCVTFIITRDHAPEAPQACQVRVLLDGSAFADLHPGERADGYVEPGAHTLGALPRSSCGEAVETQVVLDQDSEHYQIRFDARGAVHITPGAF